MKPYAICSCDVSGTRFSWSGLRLRSCPCGTLLALLADSGAECWSNGARLRREEARGIRTPYSCWRHVWLARGLWLTPGWVWVAQSWTWLTYGLVWLTSGWGRFTLSRVWLTRSSMWLTWDWAHRTVTRVGVTFDSLARAILAVFTYHRWNSTVKVLSVHISFTYLLTCSFGCLFIITHLLRSSARYIAADSMDVYGQDRFRPFY